MRASAVAPRVAGGTTREVECSRLSHPSYSEETISKLRIAKLLTDKSLENYFSQVLFGAACWQRIVDSTPGLKAVRRSSSL